MEPHPKCVHTLRINKINSLLQITLHDLHKLVADSKTQPMASLYILDKQAANLQMILTAFWKGLKNCLNCYLN